MTLRSPKYEVKTVEECILEEFQDGLCPFNGYRRFCAKFGNDVISYREFDYWWYQLEMGRWEMEYDGGLDTPKPELMDMPREFLEEVVKRLRWEDRASLQKTNTSFRRLVNSTYLYIQQLRLVCFHDLARLQFQNQSITYQPAFGGLLVQSTTNYKMIKSMKPWRRASLDLTVILKNRNTEIGELSIDFHVSLKTKDQKHMAKLFRYELSRLGFQISVEYFEIHAKSHHDVMTILPYLKPAYLTNIDVITPDNCSMKIRKIMKTEQVARGNNIRIMAGLSTPDEVVQFRNMFMTSPTFVHFRLQVHDVMMFEWMKKRLGYKYIFLRKEKLFFKVLYNDNEHLIIFFKMRS